MDQLTVELEKAYKEPHFIYSEQKGAKNFRDQYQEIKDVMQGIILCHNVTPTPSNEPDREKITF
jgi:hypothetical protein